MYSCKVCQLQLKDAESLALHQCGEAKQARPLDPKALLTCDDCSRRFSSNPRVFWFRNAGLPQAQLRETLCQICGISLLQESSRPPLTGADAVVMAPELLSRSFDCKICGVSFKRGDRLLAHSRMHTGEKPFVCDICDSSFSRKDRLKAHRLAHEGNLKFKCNICSKAFTQAYHLSKHKKVSF